MLGVYESPCLVTERLLLRPARHSDLPYLHHMRSDPGVAWHMGIRIPRDETVSYDYLHAMMEGVTDGDWIYWAVATKTDDCFIGSLVLWNYRRIHHDAEIGYCLAPNHQHQGYMYEAMQAVMRYSFLRLKLRQLVVHTGTANEASLKLLKRCSFTLASYLLQENLRGEQTAMARYTLSRSAWLKMQKINRKMSGNQAEGELTCVLM